MKRQDQLLAALIGLLGLALSCVFFAIGWLLVYLR